MISTNFTPNNIKRADTYQLYLSIEKNEHKKKGSVWEISKDILRFFHNEHNHYGNCFTQKNILIGVKKINSKHNDCEQILQAMKNLIFFNLAEEDPETTNMDACSKKYRPTLNGYYMSETVSNLNESKKINQSVESVWRLPIVWSIIGGLIGSMLIPVLLFLAGKL